MKDLFKELKVLGRKVALHKINNKCIGNNIYKYKHDFSHLLELVLESRLEPIREPRFRRPILNVLSKSSSFKNSSKHSTASSRNH